jgi:hypothetical protein
MRALVVAVVLLLAVGGGGFVNYQRNAPLDRDLEFRPYKGLSDTDLAALRDAYVKSVGQMESSLGNPDDGVFRKVKPGDFQGKVQAFERFQKENERWKEGHRAALENKATIDAIQREQGIRKQGLDDPWKRILRRATTF